MSNDSNPRDEWDAAWEVTRRPVCAPAERDEHTALRDAVAAERAAVVAYLNATSLRLEENDDPEWGIIADLALHIKAGFHIERGEHRREEEG
jgi:hypothetical protein